MSTDYSPNPVSQSAVPRYPSYMVIAVPKGPDTDIGTLATDEATIQTGPLTDKKCPTRTIN